MHLSRYTFLIEDEGKYYLYNTLSNSLIESDKEMLDFLKKHKDSRSEVQLSEIPKNEYSILKENLILTDNDDDDFLIYKASIMALRIQQSSMHLTVAPTMECCFNCHYCFERTKKKGRISDQTIQHIVNYVVSHKMLKSLHLTWFGGEPLMAVDRIESFYDRFIEMWGEEKEFSSNIITSGYHIDEEAIRILKKVRVTAAQITLDGLKETHNRIKNTPECDDVFTKVTDNIKLMAQSAPEISVIIRVNLSRDNANEYTVLYQMLSDKYKNYRNVAIAPAFVMDRGCNASESPSYFFSHKQRSEYVLHLASLNMDSFYIRYPQPYFSECAIRSPNAISFDPEGYAYKCWEKIGDRNYSVWRFDKDGKIVDLNTKNINRQQYGADPLDDPTCSQCAYLPICGGGCPIQRIENRFEGGTNNLCTHYKGFIKDFIKLHVRRIQHNTMRTTV